MATCVGAFLRSFISGGLITEVCQARPTDWRTKRTLFSNVPPVRNFLCQSLKLMTIILYLLFELYGNTEVNQCKVLCLKERPCVCK